MTWSGLWATRGRPNELLRRQAKQIKMKIARPACRSRPDELVFMLNSNAKWNELDVACCMIWSGLRSLRTLEAQLTNSCFLSAKQTFRIILWSLPMSFHEYIHIYIYVCTELPAGLVFEDLNYYFCTFWGQVGLIHRTLDEPWARCPERAPKFIEGVEGCRVQHLSCVL